MATALGEEIPEKLRADAGPYYQRAWALSPAVPLALRATGAQRAAREGLLSSAAMVDLYSQIYTLDNPETPEGVVAVLLRRAYRAADPAVRVQAMRDIWGGEGVPADDDEVADQPRGQRHQRAADKRVAHERGTEHVNPVLLIADPGEQPHQALRVNRSPWGVRTTPIEVPYRWLSSSASTTLPITS